MTSKQPKRKIRPGVDKYGRTPLHDAVICGDLEAVCSLLAAGAAPDACDDDGRSPLHFAARENRPKVAIALLDAGASVDLADANGNTPLFDAVFSSKGEGDLIDALRERGADPKATNLYGVSPVSLARTIANFDVARFFSDLPHS